MKKPEIKGCSYEDRHCADRDRFEEPKRILPLKAGSNRQQEGADAIFFPEMSFTDFPCLEKVAAYVNPIRQTAGWQRRNI
ncbi:MAG: hypothetical protein ACLTXT_05950 [Ruminococcus callidus]